MQLTEVTKGYTRAAPKYDKRLKFWFGTILGIEKYRREAVDGLCLKEGDTVLEIGCGTGANFPYLLDKIGTKGQIIGIDYTAAMLQQARKKIKQKGWKNIKLIQGDATQIDCLVKIKVDALISTYCLSILCDMEKTVLKALKLLKPDGRIAFLDVQRIKTKNRVLQLLYPFYAWLLKKDGISSDEDLDEKRYIKQQLFWKEIKRKKLKQAKQKDFLFGIFFLLTGTR